LPAAALPAAALHHLLLPHQLEAKVLQLLFCFLQPAKKFQLESIQVAGKWIIPDVWYNTSPGVY
jgi:hypothetical protein